MYLECELTKTLLAAEYADFDVNDDLKGIYDWMEWAYALPEVGMIEDNHYVIDDLASQYSDIEQARAEEMTRLVERMSLNPCEPGSVLEANQVGAECIDIDYMSGV